MKFAFKRVVRDDYSSDEGECGDQDDSSDTQGTLGFLDDAAASNLNVALERLSLANRPASAFDNFYTPENVNFYSQKPYFKLDNRRHEIRLLKVYPQKKTYSQHIQDHPEWQAKGRSGLKTMRIPQISESEEPIIACELLDKIPLCRVDGRYHALSYCAGSPKDVSKVLINGIIFNAFANLEHAIHCALNFWNSRSSDEELLLWADQICINQEDLVERSSQVGMMRDIYRRSQDAIICISTQVSDTSRRHKESLEPFIDGGRWIRYGPSRRQRIALDDIELFKYTNLPALAYWPSSFDSICVFLSRPWWSRAWVYQEFIMAPRAYFVYWESTVSWAELSTVLEEVSSLEEEQLKDLENNISKSMKESETEEDQKGLRSAQDSIKSALDLLPKLRSCLGLVTSFVKGKARQKKVFGLKELLQHSRQCQASDPRDKIYAFLGLADQGYGIIPKYTRENTIVHVLIHTAQRIITFEGNLDILEHVSEGREKLGTLLPSWVPDWTSKGSKMFSQNFDQLVNTTRLRDSNEKPFQASKEEIGAPEFLRDEFNDSILDLKVKGIYVGSLTDIDGSLYDNSPVQTFLTPSGLRVHTSQVAAYDDEVWVLYGARKPVILRLDQGERYSFLSEALVCGHDGLISGIMFGSMVDMMRNNKAKVQDITIA